MTLNRWALLAFRLIVGGVLLWAGVLKIFDPLGFAQNIAAYRLFPRAASLLLAVTLPYVESACGLLLILGLFRRAAALLASAIFSCFVVLVGVTMIRGLDVACGCFGSLSGRADVRLLAQDIVLFALSLVVLLAPRDALSLDERLELRRRPAA